MRRIPLLVVLVGLLASLLPVTTVGAQETDPTLRPPDGSLEADLIEARASSVGAAVDGLVVDGADVGASPTFTGDDVTFLVEGDGLNVRYVNGIEVGGERIYTLDAVSGFSTLELPVPAHLLHPGDNTITFFSGERPGTCNKDDFDLRNARLRLADGTEVTDPAHPADEEITLGDGRCGSNETRPREASWTFTLPEDAGSGPLGLAADVDAGTLQDGPHEVAATAGDATTTHTVWTDASLTDPDHVDAVSEPDTAAVEQLVEAEELLPPAIQDIAVEATNNCCMQKFNGDGRLLAGVDTDEYGPAVDGSSFTLDVPVAGSGRYAVAVDLVTGPDHGIVELAVDGETLGEPFDTHTPEVAVHRRVVFGTTELDDGMAQLAFTVTGANPDATGRLVGVDAIRFEPVPFEGTLLSPSDQAVVRGHVPIVGFTLDEHPAGLTVDGADPGPRQLLGGQSASLVFEGGGGNGMQGAFANRISVRGREIRIPGNVQNWTTDAVGIPGELLQPGENTVTFIAGRNAGCNHDDFDIRNVRLELPDGTVLRDPTVGSSNVVFGDSICNDDVGGVSKALEYDFTFVIPEPGDGASYRPGMGLVWDSTAVTDGEHELALERRDGMTLAHTVVVDNTAPEITATVPAEGDHLKGEVTLAVDATDATSGVATTSVTIDGEAHEVGEALSSDDLADGEHELVATVTDMAGIEATTTVSFTSIGESPDEVAIIGPTEGADDVATAPTLQVHAVDPDGDPLDVTFLEADLGEPSPGAAWSGSTTGTPEGLASTEAEPITDVDAALRADDERLVSPSSRDLPYQRFDLPVPDGTAELEVSWEGQVDPAREVLVSAWSTVEEAWVELDRRRGDADGDLRLQVPVRDEFVDGDVVHALVQGSDPFADDIADEPDEQFRDPETYDFSLAWITDTQYLPEGYVAGGPTADRFAAAYRAMTDWIVDNAETRKIDYVAHTGDIINNWITIDDESDGYEQRARDEFQFASDTMAVLEDARIPYGVTPGNHDNKFGTANQLFNEYFPPSRFQAASEAAEQDYFGGAWQDDDYHNHYDLFSAGGQDFIVVYLGFIADEDEIAWANDVLAAHADRNAIFATHEYLRPSLQPDGRDGPVSDENARSQGRQLLEDVILPNDNVFLTLSGHTHGVALNIRRDVGPEHSTVVEMLANYQFYRVGGERRTGHMRLLQFDTERSEVSVNTYSPVLDDHNAEEFDTNYARNYTAAADEFTVPVDLASRTTTFGTDAIYLAARSDREIATTAVGDDGAAAATWTDLDPETRYGWYAVADDGRGGRTASSTATFTTAEPLTVDVAIDPTTPDGADGWYTSPVTITATPSDPDATVEMHLGDEDWQAADDGVAVDEDGITTVAVRAVRGDETTEVSTVRVRLDTVAPETGLAGIADGEVVGDASVLELSATGTDATSSVANVELRLDGDVLAAGSSPQTVSVPAWTLDLDSHALEVVATDTAGHVTTVTVEFEVTTSVDDLLAHVDRLTSDGTLDRNRARRMRQSLEQARRHLDAGRTPAARRQLAKARREAESVADANARVLLLRDLDAVLHASD